MLVSGDAETSCFTHCVCLFTHGVGNGERRDKWDKKGMVAKFPMMPIALMQGLSL